MGRLSLVLVVGGNRILASRLGAGGWRVVGGWLAGLAYGWRVPRTTYERMTMTTTPDDDRALATITHARIELHALSTALPSRRQSQILC